MKHATIKKVCISVFYLLFLFLIKQLAYADSVELEMNQNECIVGESIIFTIKITLDEDKKIDVSNVRYNSKQLNYDVNTTDSSSFVITINGKTMRSSSDFVKNYTFRLLTDKIGTFKLPSFKIIVGNTPFFTKKNKFTVFKRPGSENLLFITNIENHQPYYYPSQIFTLNCKILYRDFSGSSSIENISLPIMENRSFLLIPDKETNWEATVNHEKLRVLKTQHNEVVNGKRFNVLSFDLKFRMMDSGRFEFDSFIKLIVVFYKRGFFGPEPFQKTAYAESLPLKIVVKSLPQQDVPAFFNGAIGNFSIQVVPSSDTDIKVGDPIILSIEIAGQNSGALDFVKCFPVHKIKEITDYFKVSSDPVVGQISEDGKSKSFLVRMRVKSKTVKAIPPIPFTFFDIVKKKYVTIYSDPVPVTIYDSASKIQIVDFSGKSEQKKETNNDYAVSEVKQSKDDNDIITPEIPPLIQISDNVAKSCTRVNHMANYNKLYYTLYPFFVFFLCIMIKKYKSKEIDLKKLTERRSKKSYKNFLKNIKPFEKSDFDSSVFYRNLGRNITNFIQERFLLESDCLDTHVCDQLVENGKISKETMGRLIDIIEKVDHRRYSSMDFDIKKAREIMNQAKEVLQKC